MHPGRWLPIVVALILLAPATPRLEAPSAVAQEGDRIDSPAEGSRVSGIVEIRGRAVGSDPATFSYFRLYYGLGAAPSVLRPVGPAVDQPVEDGRLGMWDTRLLTPGDYTLLLTVYDTAGRPTSTQIMVTVEATPTPTPPAQRPPFVYPTPGEVPTPGPQEEAPVLPEQVPPAPVQPIEVPPPAPPPPAPIPGVAPPESAPAPPPPPQVQSEPIGPAQPQPLPPPLPAPPSDSIPIATPAPPMDTGPAPITIPPPPPPPVVAPFEPPPPPPTVAIPTPFGIPP